MKDYYCDCSVKKPPLGVMSEKLHTEKRIRDLVSAINRYVLDGVVMRGHTGIVAAWADELSRRLKESISNEIIHAK